MCCKRRRKLVWDPCHSLRDGPTLRMVRNRPVHTWGGRDSIDKRKRRCRSCLQPNTHLAGGYNAKGPSSIHPPQVVSYLASNNGVSSSASVRSSSYRWLLFSVAVSLMSLGSCHGVQVNSDQGECKGSAAAHSLCLLFNSFSGGMRSER